MSGDVGRVGVPLHSDPSPRPPCDVLVIESTYGDRLHDRTPIAQQIGSAFRDTLLRGGVIVIPSFAVGRAQQIIYVLEVLMEQGRLPKLPIRSSAFDMDLRRPAPRLGEHTREVLQELGLPEDEIDALASRKVIA